MALFAPDRPSLPPLTLQNYQKHPFMLKSVEDKLHGHPHLSPSLHSLHPGLSDLREAQFLPSLPFSIKDPVHQSGCSRISKNGKSDIFR